MKSELADFPLQLYDKLSYLLHHIVLREFQLNIPDISKTIV